GDDTVVACLPDRVPNLLGLGAVNEALSQAADDPLEVLLEVLLGTVVVDEVLQDVARELVHAGPGCEPLVHDLAAEDPLEFEIHGRPPQRRPLGTRPMMLSSRLSRRRRMRVASSLTSTVLETLLRTVRPC